VKKGMQRRGQNEDLSYHGCRLCAWLMLLALMGSSLGCQHDFLKPTRASQNPNRTSGKAPAPIGKSQSLKNLQKEHSETGGTSTNVVIQPPETEAEAYMDAGGTVWTDSSPGMPAKPEVSRPQHEGIIQFSRYDKWTVETVAMKATMHTEIGGGVYQDGGRLHLSQGSASNAVTILRPETPVSIDRVFNTVTLWLRSNRSSGGRCTVLLEYGAEDPRPVIFNIPQEPGWHLMRFQLADRPQRPGLVMGFRFDQFRSDEAVDIHIDELTFYQDRLPKLSIDDAPARPLDLLPGHFPGRNTGKDTDKKVLGFPARKESMHPLPPSVSTKNNSIPPVSPGESLVRFTSSSPTGTLVYEIDLKEKFHGIRARWNGEELGVLTRDSVVSGMRDGELLAVRSLDSGVIRAVYSNGLRLEFSIQGRTLQIDVIDQTGEVYALSLGWIQADRAILFPLLRAGMDDQLPIYVLPQNVFVSRIIDVWRSNASDLVVGNAQANYQPDLDKKRNDCFERFYITISDELLDVLPGPANPKSKHIKGLRTRMLSDYSLPPLPELEPLVQLSDSAFKTVSPNQLHPFKRSWKDSEAVLHHNANWIRGNNAQYITKSANLHFPDLAPKLAWIISSLCQSPPWGFTDYDPRLAGTATFAQTLYDYGYALENRKVPALSAAGCGWLYAGLVDGLFLSEKSDALLPLNPLASSKHLLANCTLYASEPDPSVSIDTWICICLAYGLTPKLSLKQPLADRARLAYMLAPVLPLMDQGRHTYQYYDGIKLISASKAWLGKAVERSQLKISIGNVNGNGTEIWINGHATETWRFMLGTEEIILPPSGWYIRGKEIEGGSILDEEERVDRMRTKEWTYIDGRGKKPRIENMISSVPMLFVKSSPRQIHLFKPATEVGISTDEAAETFKALNGKTAVEGLVERIDGLSLYRFDSPITYIRLQ